MRWLHLTASTFFGGPERQMLGLSEALKPDIESRFLLFHEHGHAHAFAEQLDQRDIPCHILEADTPKFRACLRCLTRELETSRGDVLFCHGYKANMLGRIAARRVGISVVAVSRGWTWESRKVQLYNALDARHLRFMDHVVAVSEGQAEKVRAYGIRKPRLTVIRNSARLSAFTIKRREHDTRLRDRFDLPIDRVVLAAGRFSSEKGFNVLIRAAALVVKQDPRVGFVIFGEGALRAELEKLIDDLQLRQHVLLPGFIDNLDSYYSACDIVALSSYTEGLPNVLLEAAAAGLPIVATTVGGVPEVVAEGDTGYLVEPGQPVAFAQRLQQLLWDEKQRRRMGEAGRERMQELFTFEAQAEGYRRLVETLIPHARAIPVPA